MNISSKYLIAISAFWILILLIECTLHKPIVLYELPASMPEDVKAEYVKQCDKGKALYDINCACCHTSKVRGKEVIPDFTLEQIEAYQVRVSNPDHESRISEENVSAEELGLILTFLSYKKKNAVRK